MIPKSRQMICSYQSISERPAAGVTEALDEQFSASVGPCLARRRVLWRFDGVHVSSLLSDVITSKGINVLTTKSLLRNLTTGAHVRGIFAGDTVAWPKRLA